MRNEANYRCDPNSNTPHDSSDSVRVVDWRYMLYVVWNQRTLIKSCWFFSCYKAFSNNQEESRRICFSYVRTSVYSGWQLNRTGMWNTKMPQHRRRQEGEPQQVQQIQMMLPMSTNTSAKSSTVTPLTEVYCTNCVLVFCESTWTCALFMSCKFSKGFSLVFPK